MGKIVLLPKADKGLFVSLGFDFLTAESTRAVSGDARWLYLILRRYVWRKGNSLNRPVNALIKDGWIVASVAMQTLADLTGRHRDTVRALVRELDDAGWVIYNHETAGAFILGRGQDYFLDVRSGEVTRWKLTRPVPKISARRRRKLRHEPAENFGIEEDNKEEENKNRNPARASLAGLLREAPDPETLETHLATNDQTEELETEEEAALVSDENSRKSHAEYMVALAAGRADAQVAANRAKKAQKDFEAARRAEIGEQNLKSEGFPKGQRALYTQLERIWRTEFEKLQPDLKLAKWAAKERGQIGHLIEKYDPQIVAATLKYVITNWDKIRTRMYKTAVIPTVGMVLGAHESLALEAQTWEKFVVLTEQIEKWYADHPDEHLPDDLRQEREKHAKTMEALGLK